MGPDQYLRKVLAVTLWLGITIAAFWLLAVGRSFLIPLILAGFALYLTRIISGFIRKIPQVGARIPSWLSTALAHLVILVMAWLFFSVVVANAAKISEVAPKYQESLFKVYQSVLDKFGWDDPEELDDLFEKINFKSILGQVATGMTSLVSDTILVFLYFLFLSLESQFIAVKLRYIFPDEKKRESFRRVWQRIDQDIRIYLGVKVFVSLIVALGGYITFTIVGVDFAAFWALLLFCFNFIPNIGSVIATALPALLAVVQFGGFQEAIIILAVVTVFQMITGNIIEPQLTGSRLNLSPFIALVFLVFWGMIWGIAGMLLCVPIAVIMMIVFSHFESTRWLAVILSRNGEIQLTDALSDPGLDRTPPTAAQ